MPSGGHSVSCSLLLLLLTAPGWARGDCWLIEGNKGYVWLAICSQNQPPYETVPQHINATVHDLRLNENKLKAVLYGSFGRFANLTDLNLTKNEISYVEDGAFSGQANLQVLQLGYNRLSRLTEGMLRGLGRLQCLALQHNLLQAVAPAAFWECPGLSSLDLSSNRLARLDAAALVPLARLVVCELAGNPFHCGCELRGFLVWLEAFGNLTQTRDRLLCDTPRDLAGLPLLGPVTGRARGAQAVLAAACRDGILVPGMTSLPPDTDGSGTPPDGLEHTGPFQRPPTSSSSSGEGGLSPTLRLQQVAPSSASLLVQIPRPYSKMYILVQYNHSFVSDIMNLKNKKELITLNKLQPNTSYTLCVASIRNSQRYNHTCLQFSTRTPGPGLSPPSPSTTTHYIVMIVGCLFGMLILLGLIYYCAVWRRRRDEEEKAVCVKKTILEMRYGPDAAATLDSKLVLSVGGVKLGHTPRSKMGGASKGGYMEVRPCAMGEERGRDGGMREAELREEEGSELEEDSDEDGRGSASEISTIAMEVDKVNQIINNCIDALKLDSANAAAALVTTATMSPPSTPPSCPSSVIRGLIPLSSSAHETPPPPPPPLPVPVPRQERPGISGGAFVSPPYRPPPPASAVRPIQRQMSADAAVIVSSSRQSCVGSGRGRVYSLDVPEPRSPEPCPLAERASPVGCGDPLERLPLVGSVGDGGGEGMPRQGGYHGGEHRHSVPALYYQSSLDSPGPRPALLRPLSRGSYAPLPRQSNLSGYSSGPESSENSLRIWERFRPARRGPREDICYITAGNALRKKVQFAKGEDLHDILDYWKGVSAQQNL